MWFKRHWRSALGLLSFIPLIPKGVRAAWEALGFAGDVDFVVTHAQEPGWLGQVIAWLLDPPGWSIIPMIAMGLALIIWDTRRTNRPQSAQINEMPVAISYVGRQMFHNFAGFFPPGSPDDAQILSFGVVSITNTSRTERLSLELYLKFEDPPLGPAFIPADLRGPLDFMFGADDAGVKRAREKNREWMNITLPDTKYHMNPVSLEPQSTQAACLVFIFLPFMFERDKVSEYLLGKDPNMSLVVTDLVSGSKMTMPLPGEYRPTNRSEARANRLPSSPPA